MKNIQNPFSVSDFFRDALTKENTGCPQEHPLRMKIRKSTGFLRKLRIGRIHGADKCLYKAACCALAFLTFPAAHAQLRWQLADDGGIVWNTEKRLPHHDHIEMSGRSVSVVLRYGVEADGSFTVNKSMVWPLLRTVPNNTHASLMRRYNWDPLDAVTVNGYSPAGEQVQSVHLKGLLTVTSRYGKSDNERWELTRRYLPSTDRPALIELYRMVNLGKRNLLVEIPETRQISTTPAEQGVDGSYRIIQAVEGGGHYSIAPGDTLSFAAYTAATAPGEPEPEILPARELEHRQQLVNEWMRTLVLETPDSVIDRLFAFSKIRACESIYETEGGPMHGPGGESYYAAIWANDQAEYANPFFPFVGYAYGNASALNAYRHFARFINPEWKPIPSSIIAEGKDIWNGAGDRGDAAMIAYGAGRYALARGDQKEAEQLWPLIEWCLEYCRRQLNSDGVVASDCDELENRFPAGKANLCTSSLYYDALRSAAMLSKELDKGQHRSYLKQAEQLRRNIEKHFGWRMEGFDTYRYYAGNDVLRSWICIPLTVGIDERAEGTIQALFSPHLWTADGLLTAAGSKTFWDRSTLYALRGVLAVGATEKGLSYLSAYSRTRLLGEHVPYAIEAWPEGNQRHLSAESALYARIITEGLFGIRPTGFRQFDLTPRLPEAWPGMHLRRIAAFGSLFDIEVERLPEGKLSVRLIENGKEHAYRIKDGQTLHLHVGTK